MKKITSLILALVLTFSLVALSACGGKATDDKNSDSADDKGILPGGVQHRLHLAERLRSLRSEVLLPGQYQIPAARQATPPRQRLEGPAAHDHRMAHGQGFEAP